MAIITVPPALRFSKVNSFTLQRATNILRSKFTGQAQRVVYPYAVWELEATLLESDGLNAGQIRSFLAQLAGQKNSFRLPVPGYSPQHYNGKNAGYSTFGDGAANARASSLTLRIFGNYQAGIVINEGDYFQIGDEIKIATVGITTLGADLSTLFFEPPLRKSYVHLTPINLKTPTILMTARDDDVASWGLGPPIRQTGKFAAIEAVEI